MPQADLSSLHSSPCLEESKRAKRYFLPSQFLPPRITQKALGFSTVDLFCNLLKKHSVEYLFAPLFLFFLLKGFVFELCASC